MLLAFKLVIILLRYLLFSNMNLCNLPITMFKQITVFHALLLVAVIRTAYCINTLLCNTRLKLITGLNFMAARGCMNASQQNTLGGGKTSVASWSFLIRDSKTFTKTYAKINFANSTLRY